MYTPSNRARPFEKKSSRVGHAAFAELEAVALRDREDRKRMRLTVTLAVLFHAALFFVVINAPKPIYEVASSQGKKIYALQQVRFQPPPRVRQTKPLPKVKVRKIPVPDPTPDDPEPLRVAEVLESALDLPIGEDLVFDVPDGPPSTNPFAGAGDGVMEIRGDVKAPERIFSPSPAYTEEARLARIQGVVIVQAIIDTEGAVASVRPLKGLPMNLTENAIEAVKTWRFRPALLDGEPVPVYYNLTISFSLQ